MMSSATKSSDHWPFLFMVEHFLRPSENMQIVTQATNVKILASFSDILHILRL